MFYRQNADGIRVQKHIANINPLRYRGYYYDSETGLYYLLSRYYDPATGRFVNAHGVISGSGNSVHGYNLFAYCFNNPVNLTDETGNWPSWSDIGNWLNKNIVKPVADFVSKTWQNKDNIVKTFANSFELTANTGFGIGLEGESSNIGVSAGVKVKMPEVTVGSEKKAERVIEAEALVDMVFIEVGYESKDYIDGTSENINSFVFRPKDTLTIWGAEAYFIYGMGFSLNFKLKDFTEKVAVFYE